MNRDLPPYPKYKESGVPWLGQVPGHWRLLPGRACFHEKQVSNAGLKETTVLSLSYGRIVVKPPEKLRGLVPASFETYQIIDPGDIVVRPTDLQNDWNSLRFGLAADRGIITSAYMCLKPTPLLTAKYGHQLLHTYDLKKVFYGLGSGLRQNLDWRDFKYLPCVVPPLAEQAAIVRYLDNADRQIRRFLRNRRRLIELLNEIISRLTSDAVESSAEARQRFGVVAEQMSRPINRDSDNTFTAIGLFNRGRGIFHKAPTLGRDLGDSEFFWVEPGDLVFSGQFAWEGAVAIAGSDEAGCIASHRYPIVLPRRDDVLTEYLWSFFRSDEGDMLLNQHSRGAAGRNRPLNIRTLLKEKLPIPLRESQERIARLVQHRVTLQMQTAEETSLIREYRTRLIADVVTGKVDVRAAAAALPAAFDVADEDPEAELELHEDDLDDEQAEADGTLEEETGAEDAD